MMKGGAVMIMTEVQLTGLDGPVRLRLDAIPGPIQVIPFPQSGPTRALGQTHSLPVPPAEFLSNARVRMLIAPRQRGVPEVCNTPTAGRVEPGTDNRRI